MPKNTVSDPITAQEMALAHLILRAASLKPKKAKFYRILQKHQTTALNDTNAEEEL